MSTICVDDLVVNISDRSVVGVVLSTTEAGGGLRPAAELDLWDTGQGPRFSNSGRVPVRWWNDGEPYEWWEDPQFLEIVRTAPDRANLAVH